MEQSILVVEDDAPIRRLVAMCLKSNGFNVVEAWTISSVRRLVESTKFYAMILDLELEDGEGYDILRLDRSRSLVTLVISARDQIIDRIVSLELGADDYLTKPIDMRELLLRLRRSIARAANPSKQREDSLALDADGSVTLNLVERALFKGDKLVASLPSREFKILRLMFERRGKIVSREQISWEIMRRKVIGESRAVDMLVSGVRRKLRQTGSRTEIKSIRGEGYILDTREAAS